MDNAAGTRCRTKKKGFPTAERVLQLDLLHSCCRELESIDPATLLQSPWEIASGGGSVLTQPRRADRGALLFKQPFAAKKLDPTRGGGPGGCPFPTIL